ncbi:MAG TPA: hypothetical protein PLW86_16300, partial [Rhodocyclaceae bacterium]|nr:hypothetical protein [Rhodocyclaceae bacterium]
GVIRAFALAAVLWGVVGMFLSTPLAVMAMAILAEFQGSRWVAVLLSGDGEPYADEGKPKGEKTPSKPRRKPTTKDEAEAAKKLADAKAAEIAARQEEEARHRAEEDKKAKAEQIRQAKKERERSCQIKPVMSDAEIANCKTVWK